jgi:hypothetical protein
MNWLTNMEYLCHKSPRICSTCRKHSPVLSSFMTYQNYFTSYGNNFISSWIFSIKGNHVKLPRCLKPFSCLIVFGVYIWLFFAFVSTPKAPPPTFRPISKAWPSPLLPFVTPLHMFNVLKISDWRKGSRTFRDWKSENFKITKSNFFYLKKSKFWLNFFMNVPNAIP